MQQQQPTMLPLTHSLCLFVAALLTMTWPGHTISCTLIRSHQLRRASCAAFSYISKKTSAFELFYQLIPKREKSCAAATAKPFVGCICWHTWRDANGSQPLILLVSQMALCSFNMTWQFALARLLREHSDIYVVLVYQYQYRKSVLIILHTEFSRIYNIIILHYTNRIR